MPSMGKIISGHNNKVMGAPTAPPPCNCTIYDCPLQGECQTQEIIYQCNVKETQTQNEKNYIGLTERTFKDRYTKWRTAFNKEGYHKNSLSSHVWYLKRNNIDFVLSWQIVAKGKQYSPSTKSCNLCLKEIYYILFEKKRSSLNKRNQFLMSNQ